MAGLQTTPEGDELLEKLFGQDPKWWVESLGRIELKMTMEQAEMVPLVGDADDGVLALSKIPEIKAQMDKIKPELLAECLDEYGVWDQVELKDNEQNIQRLLWIAACDIREEK